ncbi:MAG: AgmX/PglI C-terminal domain-containing protein [Fibrobacterota bacterium]
MSEPTTPAAPNDPRLSGLERQPMYDYDRWFILFIAASIVAHVIFMVMVKRVDTTTIKEKTIEEMPQRIARLLMDKPKKPEKKKIVSGAAQAVKTTETQADVPPSEGKGQTGAPSAAGTQARKAAQVNVARRASKIEQELRSTGMLAVLSGMGPTRSRGRAVVDVLGGKRVGNADLDAVLRNVTGVQRAGSEADMEVKLTTRRVVESSQAVSIADMVSGFGRTEKTLQKLGDIQVSKPKTVGNAVNSANRNDQTIMAYVKSNMRSIMAEYNRLLKANPSLSGKITVRFTILANGTVTDVEISETTVDDAALQDRILRVVKNWMFPAIAENEGDITVNFPFVFQPN